MGEIVIQFNTEEFQRDVEVLRYYVVEFRGENEDVAIGPCECQSR